jgi:AcrR family transcriptional regulator
MVSSVLLDTAIDRFGQFGFEGASTRDIARASGTAMSSITYHFGGKHGLYLAAADHIAAGIAALQSDRLAAARATGDASREAARDAALGLIDGFGRMMLAKETEAWSRFIIREQQAPTEAFQRIFDGAMRALSDTVIALVARARPDLADREARATAILLVGQALVLRAGRAAVCRVLDTDELDARASDLLLRRLHANTRCILSETPE